MKNVCMILAILLVGMCGVAAAEDSVDSTAYPGILLDSAIYAYITDVYTGPFLCAEKGDSGWCRYYRLVVTEWEIYHHVWVELIETDGEGCRRTVESGYMIEDEAYPQDIDDGEFGTSVSLVEWSSFDVVKIKLKNTCYQLKLAPTLTDLKIKICE
ncbi:MAG: hypothetical protein PHR28_01985 [candidate division Zixibacteria bacterium]|nr:hypothetical protein [candidate division Zixibacteria bacterium]